MSIVQQRIRIFAALFVLILTIVIVLPFATRPSDAATFGGFTGVTEGASIQGVATIQAITSSDVTRVNFQLSGPTSATFIDQAAPFYYNGDTNGVAVGWNTATMPNGAYTLRATLVDTAGKRLSRQVNFTIANQVVPTLAPIETKAIYSDSVTSGWNDWSWNISANYGAASPYQGKTALGVTFLQPWSGLYLHTDTLTQASALRFWVHGGGVANRQIGLFVSDSSGKAFRLTTVTPQANAWTEVIAPITSAIPSGQVNGVIWQEVTGTAQPVFYLDNIALVTSAISATPQPTIAPTQVIAPTAIPTQVVAPTAIPTVAPTQVIAPTAIPTTAPVATPPAPPAGGFLETFNGSPASPQAWQPTNWDIVVHRRAITTQMDAPMHAGHGMDCGPTPGTHMVSDFSQAVFQCRDHVMTALNAEDYGVIYLTPNQQVDFSNGEAVIRWDVSTARSSLRDFTDVWITPYEDNMAVPLNDFFPDGNGEPRRAIQVTMDAFNGQTTFKARSVSNYQPVELPIASWTGMESILAPSATRRDTFELRISRTHIKYGMPAYNLWWIDTDIPDQGWSRGVVQFGHHSYNPTKDCTTCAPNTWHWDNISIAPAVPFTIIRGNRAIVTPADAGQPIQLAQPAPANAHLRFSGVLDGLQASFDGGRSWTPAQLQQQKMQIADHFQNYWMPIPAGTTAVLFRNTGSTHASDWMIRDISVWSR